MTGCNYLTPGYVLWCLLKVFSHFHNNNDNAPCPIELYVMNNISDVHVSAPVGHANGPVCTIKGA